MELPILLNIKGMHLGHIWLIILVPYTVPLENYFVVDFNNYYVNTQKVVLLVKASQ